MGLGSVFARGKKVMTIQYLHIDLAGYPISLGWSGWIRQISSKYSFGVTIGQPDRPSNIMWMVLSD
jgi:hypothetical protein